ncbi:rhodanese-like domain-containing protein [Haliea sp. E17]|uniref:rhodanese-like domain-containing protein n=1 Tax=Haliea sp. E17 TaxID=3401576 RepID=UPI003AAF6417
MRKISVLLLSILLAAPALADAVWIDVRTPEEFAEDHIAGDKLVPYEDILPAVTEAFPDKSTEIHLYCGSGRRAGIAKAQLDEAGYTNVVNAGGIDDARKQRGLEKTD